MQKTLGLIGARGHTGAELITLLSQHDGFELVLASSRANAGRAVSDIVAGFDGKLCFANCSADELVDYPVDALVLALPNDLSADYVSAWERHCNGGVLIDLSADRRFDENWYYGLPELTRDHAGGKTRIANPGCYATAMQLALAPVISLAEGTPYCFGVSGYSGAGTRPSEKNDPDRLANNLIPYSPVGHVHQHEVSRQLGRPTRFLPHVASFFRGIIMTVCVRLQAAATIDEIRNLFYERYAGEALIRLDDNIPHVADVAGRHHACVGGWQLSDDGRDLVVYATLDNLLKGAATQALQNLNIACGFDEYQGIPHG